VNTGKLIQLASPPDEKALDALRTGNRVHISGVLYTARDAAHKRMREQILNNQKLPFDPAGQIVFYVGPTPAPPGRPFGSAGPTTAGRMDPYTPMLIERGLKGMIGKGRRSPQVRAAALKYGCVYFGAVEGSAALLSECVRSAETIAYADLGTEAIQRIIVENFPAVVLNDLYGGDLYEEGRRRFQKFRPDEDPSISGRPKQPVAQNGVVAGIEGAAG